MPSTITHSYFTLDVVDKLDQDIKDRMLPFREKLKIFGQGPDVFFFYNLATFKQEKTIRHFGKTVHNNETQSFFINLITYIKDNKLTNNYDVMAFLYGFICHYILDSTCHPFIIYKAGVYDKTNLDSLKYNSLHNDMETFIDAYFINKKENIDPKKFKLHEFCFNLEPESRELIDTFNYVFNETFGVNNIYDKYKSSVNRMKKLYKLLRYDQYGIKKIAYNIFDAISPRKIMRFKQISFAIDYKNKKHYLNLEKNKWNHPCDKDEIYDLSFIELYVISVHKAVDLINEVNKYLYKNKKINLKKLFDNSSYITGKDCLLDKELKYFEF